MSAYAAITGGMFAFIAYEGAKTWWPFCFLIVLTFVGFFHTIRWTYAFECHREKVNKLTRIILSKSKTGASLDPTMNIPAMCILPKSICKMRMPSRLQQIVNQVFRTRYWFPLLYFFILIGLVILSFAPDFSVWVQVIAIIALVIAFFLGIGWYSSLKQIGKEKKVILEGCNGEWAQECYLPLLVKKAAKGEIELWAVDIEDEIKLGNPQAKKDWQVARSKNRAQYLNKNKDIQIYSELSNADHIFVVAPDRVHCEIATFFLDRLATGGKIFIEKPLDASVGAALKLREKIKEKGQETVFAFDHYLANAYPFLQNKASYLRGIGEIRKIEFHILEPDGISPQREKTLDKGMIFDLFCHVLALVCAVPNQNLACLETKLRTIKLEDVKAARYVGCPISGETFAWIKFMVNSDVQVVTAIGKCVGTSDEKFMRLYDSNGTIKLDFVEDEFSVFDSPEKQIKKGKLLSKHVEGFLEGLLLGKKPPLSVPGVLSFEAALEILKILDEAKRRIDKMPEYRCHESISEILERF